MLPAAFVVLEKFPLTPNGKIDRKALPAPEGLRLQTEERYVVPRTGTERVITGIWQDVLRLEKVGVNDNFFDLGGNSLLMTQVHVRLCEKTHREISMLEMFQYPRISALAEYLGRQGDGPTLPDKDDDRAGKLKEGKNRLKQRIRRRDETARN
jgi:acyl carrier protein